MTADEVAEGQSVQALYHNILAKAAAGYVVESGGAVTVNSGDLGQSDTLSVGAADYYFGGTATAAGSPQNVQIDAADPNDPRRDVVYFDTNGDAQVSKGEAAATPSAQPDASRFEFYNPAPNDLKGTNAVVLAEVWVPAGASSISSADVADRRTLTQVLGRVDVTELNGTLTGSAPLTDIAGTNLSISGGTLNAAGGSSGAPTDATYVTIDDESGDLSNSDQHTDLTGGDLHDPAEHDNAAHSTDYAEANHDNGEHSEAFVSDGDGTTRQIWVIANGASDPAGAGADDIIFEEES